MSFNKDTSFNESALSDAGIPEAKKGEFCKPGEHRFKYLGGDCACTKCGYFVTPKGDLYRNGHMNDEGIVQHTENVVPENEDEFISEGCHHYPENACNGFRQLKMIGDKIVIEKSASASVLAAIANVINSTNMVPTMTRAFKSIEIIETKANENYDLMICNNDMQSVNEFVGRFVDGKETILDRLALDPVLRIKLNPKCIAKMERGKQLVRFFKSLFEYCNKSVDVFSNIMFAELLQSGYVFKELVKRTELIGLVTLPLTAILVFDEIDINAKHPISCRVEDPDYMATINSVRYIINQARLLLDKHYTNMDYLIKLNDPSVKSKPDKDNIPKEAYVAKGLLDDLKKIVKHANAKVFSEHTKANDKLIDGLTAFTEGAYDTLAADIADRVISENVEETIYTEGTKKVKVKKLKKIPADIIPYILIEAEAIRDANDKMMIASYAYAKMELIDFYLEVLETGSKRYIVPHNKPYLENLKRQLQAAIKKIMDTPVPTINSPIIKIEYPNGYEG